MELKGKGTNMVIDLFQIPNQYYDVTISYDGPEIFFAITKDQNPGFADTVIFSAFKGNAAENTIPRKNSGCLTGPLPRAPT